MSETIGESGNSVADKLSFATQKIGDIFKNQEKFETVVQTLLFSNIAVQISDALSFGIFSSFDAALIFLGTLAIFGYGVWSVSEHRLRDMVIFAGLLLLLQIAKVFGLQAPDQILLSSAAASFIMANEYLSYGGKTLEEAKHALQDVQLPV